MTFVLSVACLAPPNKRTLDLESGGQPPKAPRTQQSIEELEAEIQRLRSSLATSRAEEYICQSATSSSPPSSYYNSSEEEEDPPATQDSPQPNSPLPEPLQLETVVHPPTEVSTPNREDPPSSPELGPMDTVYYPPAAASVMYSGSAPGLINIYWAGKFYGEFRTVTEDPLGFKFVNPTQIKNYRELLEQCSTSPQEQDRAK